MTICLILADGSVPPALVAAATEAAPCLPLRLTSLSTADALQAPPHDPRRTLLLGLEAPDIAQPT